MQLKEKNVGNKEERAGKDNRVGVKDPVVGNKEEKVANE